MLNSKQRSNLRSIAANTETLAQMGKTSVDEDSGEFSKTFLSGISDALEARELVKISVLKNAPFTVKEISDDLADALGAECVATIGRKIILYRRSSKKDIKHIDF